jgi:hypothetical protein
MTNVRNGVKSHTEDESSTVGNLGQLNKFNSKGLLSAGQDELVKDIHACLGELKSEIQVRAIKADHSKCEKTTTDTLEGKL